MSVKYVASLRFQPTNQSIVREQERKNLGSNLQSGGLPIDMGAVGRRVQCSSEEKEE